MPHDPNLFYFILFFKILLYYNVIILYLILFFFKLFKKVKIKQMIFY